MQDMVYGSVQFKTFVLLCGSFRHYYTEWYISFSLHLQLSAELSLGCLILYNRSNIVHSTPSTKILCGPGVANTCGPSLSAAGYGLNLSQSCAVRASGQVFCHFWAQGMAASAAAV